jgi:hypothetical protein
MRKLISCSYVLVVALLCAAVVGCQSGNTTSGSATMAAPSSDSGRLVIHRAANLAETLIVSIDGAKVSELGVGDSYSGSLSPGPHTLSVILEPNQLNLKPTVKHLTVAKGQAFTFTAAWKAEKLVLL